MKLIDKLAREFKPSGKPSLTDIPWVKDDVVEGFKAGMEKFRELMLKELEDFRASEVFHALKIRVIGLANEEVEDGK